MSDLTRPSDLATALRGTRALLLDLDGVIVVAERPIPGAPDAVATLERRRIPYRIVTNTSAVSRATLSRWAGMIGASIPPAPTTKTSAMAAASAEMTARRNQMPSGPRRARRNGPGGLLATAPGFNGSTCSPAPSSARG